MNQKHRVRIFILLIGLVWASGFNVSLGKAVMSTNISTDKARYIPGETVQVTLYSEQAFSQADGFHLAVFSPEGIVSEGNIASYALDERGHTLQISWQPSAEDFRGYLVQVSAHTVDGSKLLAEIAVDVSSSWVKFPRYGYLWDFTENAIAEAKIEALNRYHINSLQYYDWQYRHHQPLSQDSEKWQDWSARWIYGDVLRRYIAAAAEHHMTNMAYNMIYAANKTYLRDGSGIDPAWRLINAKGEDFTCVMSQTRGNVGILQFFNILNPNWQAHIFQTEIEALDAMGFDGWHGDTIGEYGAMTTADGQPLGLDDQGNPIHLVKDGYTIFLDKAKAALGERYLTFNPVGAQGIEKVSVSDVDVLYSEFWPWEKSRWDKAFDNYATLQKEIFDAASVSGGKSLVVAAYVNYRAAQTTFNPPAVRLLDAVVYASGGSRIELGNGDNMLSDEYFPADIHKVMSEDLRQQTVMLYDFITAYQNLLRDGQTPIERTVLLENIKHSTTGQNDAVWTFVMADRTYEILHLINLTGTDNRWRDETQTKAEPTVLENITVKYYTDLTPQTVTLASPDGESIAPQALSFTVEQDGQGRYLAFTLPSLKYWNMIFMR